MAIFKTLLKGYFMENCENIRVSWYIFVCFVGNLNASGMVGTVFNEGRRLVLNLLGNEIPRKFVRQRYTSVSFGR